MLPTVASVMHGHYHLIPGETGKGSKGEAMAMYSVTVIREVDGWIADIAGLPSNKMHRASYGSWSALHEEMPQLIADLAKVESTDVELDYRYEINGHDVTADVVRLKEELPKAPQSADVLRRDPVRARALVDETFVKNIEMFGHRFSPS
jgi:hypothetical protein